MGPLAADQLRLPGGVAQRPGAIQAEGRPRGGGVAAGMAGAAEGRSCRGDGRAEEGERGRGGGWGAVGVVLGKRCCWEGKGVETGWWCSRWR